MHTGKHIQPRIQLLSYYWNNFSNHLSFAFCHPYSPFLPLVTLLSPSFCILPPFLHFALFLHFVTCCPSLPFVTCCIPSLFTSTTFHHFLFPPHSTTSHVTSVSRCLCLPVAHFLSLVTLGHSVTSLKKEFVGSGKSQRMGGLDSINPICS